MTKTAIFRRACIGLLGPLCLAAGSQLASAQSGPAIISGDGVILPNYGSNVHQAPVGSGYVPPPPYWGNSALPVAVAPLPGGPSLMVITGEGTQVIEAPPLPKPTTPAVFPSPSPAIAPQTTPAGQPQTIPITVTPQAPSSEPFNQTEAQAQASDGVALSPQRPRYYLHFRYGRSVFMDDTITSGLDADPRDFGDELFGAAIGYNWNRYFGFELAGEFRETTLEATGPGGGEIGEYTIISIIPQVRLRYPMHNDRLVPYIIGGVGGASTEFNDRTTLGNDPSFIGFGGEEFSMTYSLGAGLEYHVADNIAFGVELKYIFHEADIETPTGDSTADLDTLLVTAGTRILFHGPEREPRDMPTGGVFDFDDGFQPYLGMRIGYALGLEQDLTEDFHASNNPRNDGREQIKGITIGADISPYWSIDFSLEAYETPVRLTSIPGLEDKVRELAVWTAVPEVRLRYPLWEGLANIYGMAGIGAAFSEANDRTSLSDLPGVPQFSIRDVSPVGTLGLGFEYFFYDNLSVAFESRYLYHRPDAEIDGVDEEINLDSILLSLLMRLYFD